MSPPLLRLSLVDLNNGVPNQAIRCFRRILDAFAARVREVEPSLRLEVEHVQPRNLGELPRRDADLVLSTGGPGAPTDGYDDPWCTGYRAFLDHVVDANLKDAARAPKAFLVCHSFEIAVIHFALAEMRRRPSTKFGVMPVYVTEHGRDVDYLRPFADRLFSWEHRNWEAVGLVPGKLDAIGGKVLSLESRPNGPHKGDAILGLDFGPGMTGTQFHPEADRPGVLAWIDHPEHAAAFRKQYGDDLYAKMVKSLGDPTRLARTFALLIPGWLAARYNGLAAERGWRPLDPPEMNAQTFEAA